MKSSLYNHEEEASVLVVALLTITVLMVSMGAFLGLVSYQLRSDTRSECWNMAIAVAEAGVEEGHAHLNQNGLSNLVSNGWMSTGSNTVFKTRRLGSNYFSVTIFSNRLARIVSQGAIWVPASTGSNYVTRKVEVTVKNPGILRNALLLLGSVGGNGGNTIIDSFSSTNGAYTLATRRDNADIQCLGANPGCVDVGNSQVYGKINTLPTGSVICANGAVGDTNWIATQTGIEPGWVDNSMRVFTLPDSPVATFTGSFPDRGSYQGTNYTYVLGTGKYYLSSLNLSGQGNMIVTGDAQLRISTSIKIAGQGCIIIASNASLTIYMEGSSASLSGLGIINQNGLASKYMFYGSTNTTSVDVTGNGDAYGVYYAPQANMKLSGNGSFCGAFVAKSVNNGGGASIHYDEELAKLDVGNYEWTIESWNEL
jgi:hypothetical protein